MIRTGTIELPRSWSCLPAAFVVAAILAAGVTRAAESNDSDEDLDVTMEVITDPKAERPSEVLQKIPLPKPKGNKPAAAAEQDKQNSKNESNEKEADDKKEGGSDKSDANDQRGTESRDRDAGEGAKERAREAREQRNEARRDENRREREPPEPPRGRPDRPGRP